MLTHIVLWKLKETAEGKSKAENAKLIKKRLESLKSKIKEIKKIDVYINNLYEGSNYDVALYAEFKDKGALEKYTSHPEHKKVGDFVSKVRLERKAVDFED